MWDDLFDVQSPVYYPNEEGIASREIFSGAASICMQTVNSDEYFPVLDARSPEWLQHVLLSSPDLVPLLSKATREEVSTRLHEVHKGVFATSNETSHDGLLSESYKAIGFTCASTRGAGGDGAGTSDMTFASLSASTLILA